MTTIKDTISLVSPSEGQAPPSWTAGTITGSGSQFEVRAASAFTPETFGVLLPVMSTSFRRHEYTLSDGAQTSGTVVVAFGVGPVAFSSSSMFICSLVDGTTGKLDVRFNTTGTSRTVTIRNIANANAVSNGSATYSTSSQYRFEIAVTFGGNIELRTYAWGSDTLIESITLAATSITQITKFYRGVTAAAAGYSASYSARIIYADGFVGSAGFAPPAGAASLSGSGTLTAARVIVPLFTYPMVYPAYPSHRGAIGPEETQGTYDRSLAAAPRAGLECDVQSASDGFVLSHDDTTTRTAASGSPFPSNDITLLTVAQFKTVQIKDLSGRGFAAESAMSLADWFARYGPLNCWLIPELKTGTDANAFADVVIASGYAWKTIVQAFSRSAAEILAGRGLEVAHLIASGGSTDWSAIKAAGINHAVRNSPLWTTGDITAAKAAGLKAGVFTIDTTTDRATQLSNGIDGLIFTNYPDLLYPGASIALSGSGSLTAGGAPSWSGAASLSGSGTLTAATTPRFASPASLSGSGTLTAVGTPRPVAAASLSGSGTLSAGGTPTASTSATLSGTGTLTAAASPTTSGSATLSGSGTLVPSGTPSSSTTATLSGSGTLTAAGAPSPAATAALSGTGTLVASGTPRPVNSAALSGTGTLAAVGGGIGAGTASLSGSGTLTAGGKLTTVGSASLSGSGTLTAVGIPALARAAALSGLGTLAALGVPGATQSVALSGVGTLTATGEASQPPSDGSFYVTVAGVRRSASVFVIVGGARRPGTPYAIIGGTKLPV